MTTPTAYTDTIRIDRHLHRRRWILRRLLRRRPSGWIPPVPPNHPDGPPFLAFTHCLRFLFDPSSVQPRLSRPRPHHGRDFFVRSTVRLIGLRYRRAFTTRMRRRRCRVLSPANLLSVFPESLAAKLFAGCQAEEARRRRGAFCRRRSGRRLLPGRAGPAQGQHDLADPAPNGFSPLSDRAGIVGELSTIDGPAALGLRDRGPRCGTDLRQPRGLPGLRRRSHPKV